MTDPAQTRPTRRATLASLGAAALLPSALAAPARAQAAFDRTAQAAESLDQLHGLAVARQGETVFSRAFRGPALDVPVNVKSVSKTMVALCLGAAIDRGVVPGVDVRLDAVAPRLIPAGADPRVGAITLEDLVSLRAGLERTSGPNYGGWVASGNWVADALSRPFVDEPGGRMLYSTGSFHVLGAALTEASGLTLLEMMRDWLGAPLNIQIPPWTRDPQGYYMGGNQMALSPLAMLRIAEMVRMQGRSDGTQVLSEEWIEASLQPRTRSPYSGLAYGYGWFLGTLAGERLAMARGYGGQIIAVLPGLEASLAITSDPNRPARSDGYFGDLLALIERQVIPDLRG
ncbi:serine hydrolase domain-containing protein [Pseudoroseicyclus aestuarii]|uniref:CubicO group peptidase (Beta-lactamase class C family) n=1 Tax=Pseudoroseicyclus aestuarii TaxID=1795041 RepID=A0A318T6D1_9RHOB|nr:serine hydrolase [Pseudoroseicyclus aestuarii]PYE85984.1 CubicO group peptidase (beta-lactamase class C family) [Pseudoroseicyclus aestuarii]